VDRPLRDLDVRRASGLPPVEALLDQERLARVRAVAAVVGRSRVIPGLVRLAARAASTECAQLSLLMEEQFATAVRCDDSTYAEQVSALADSLCSVAVLSGDVLVAADTRAHPWLHDLAPVLSGDIRSYLGFPLLLGDGTALGALCVYGSEPRAWSDRDVVLTGEVADLVALELQRLDAEAVDAHR
jgi:GAF domain-containing protein